MFFLLIYRFTIHVYLYDVCVTKWIIENRAKIVDHNNICMVYPLLHGIKLNLYKNNNIDIIPNNL